jgi:hypothetical protein
MKWVLVCASLYVGALIYGTLTLLNSLSLQFLSENSGLDTTITADIQAAASETLGHVDQLTWLGTGFPLGSLCAILPAYLTSASLYMPSLTA